MGTKHYKRRPTFQKVKRIIIVGEGPTEQAFCSEVLQPHFNTHNTYIENPTIKKNHGGIVRWEALKYQIETHLKQDSTAFVTTLIDYYGIYASHNFPHWDLAQKQANRANALNIIETGMKQDIREDLRQRFIPYIQLHEFESLLFSSLDVFTTYFEADEFDDFEYLTETIDGHENPELINNSPVTAPSKRLARILKGYTEKQKVIYGSLLAQSIGLNLIREKCPRFNNWIVTLETV